MHPPSAARAWFYLLGHSCRRLAQGRLMVYMSLGLLALFALIVYANHATGRLSMANWRMPRRSGPTHLQHLEQRQFAAALLWQDPAQSIQHAVNGAAAAVLEVSEFYVVSNWLVFTIFATFLMPIWTLSFATEALGRSREVGNLAWLLTRPLPRWSIYLATYLAALPWCLLFNVGGLWLLCILAGEPGRTAFALYWPAIFLGTFAFAALFHLLAVLSRRPGLTALLYALFLEIIAGNLPRHFKRLSISYYMRCLMFDRAHAYGIRPENPSIYLLVSGDTALWMLTAVTLGLLAVGLWLFSRREYVG